MFKKGQRAWLLGNWDGKGTVYFKKVIIEAWGSKIARLFDAENNLMEEANFHVNTFDGIELACLPETADPVAEGLAMSKRLKAKLIAAKERLIRDNSDHDFIELHQGKLDEIKATPERAAPFKELATAVMQEREEKSL